MRAEKVVRVRPFWVLSLLLALRPLQVTSVMLLSWWHYNAQAVWARCWWALVSRWPPRPQPAPHHPEGPVTLSQAVVCLNNGEAKTFHDYNFRCVHHSTINLKWLGRSVLVGEYLGFILALILSVSVLCTFDMRQDWQNLSRFLQIQNNEAAMMKSANLLRYKPNWCAMPECWVQCSLAAS